MRTHHRQDQLPPPAPQDAAIPREVEARIREDERTRVQAELAELANGTRHDEDAVRRDDRRSDDGVDPWDEFARDRTADERVADERYADGVHHRDPSRDPDADTGDINLAALRGDDRTERTAVIERDDDREPVGRREYVEDDVVRDRAFSVGQAITLLVGLALAAWGIIALVATGIDTPLDQPVEEVFGFDHTPWMGIGETAAGLLLILAALRPQGRWLAGLVGVALIAAGAMIVAEVDWTVDELRSEQAFGWIPIVAGALALLGAVLTPPRHQHVTETHVVDDYDRRRDY